MWETLGFVEGSGNSNSPKSYEYIDTDVPVAEVEYRLKQIDTDGGYEYYSTLAQVNNNITDVEEGQLPTEFNLSQNYLNPFNPSTTISYSISSAVISNPNGVSGEKSSKISLSARLPVGQGRNDMINVTLKVYDLLGREVETLVNEYQVPGNYEVKLDGSSLSSGVYYYTLKAEEFVQTKKLMLLK